MQLNVNHIKYFWTRGIYYVFVLWLLAGSLELYGQEKPNKIQEKRPSLEQLSADPNHQAEGETKQIQILNADVLTFVRRNGEPIQKLIGNVKILQDSTYFFCDSAYHLEQANRLEAYGNVRVLMPDSVELVADRIEYDANTRIADVYDHITLTDNDVILTTDRMIYDRNEKFGKYLRGGELLNGQDTLTSITGYYYSQENMAYFRQKVKLKSPDYTLTTDTLGYNTKTKVAYFISPTLIVSDEGEILATVGEYDSENKEIELFGRSTVKDSTYILTADSLFYKDTTSFGRAIGNIFIQQEDSTFEIRGQYGTFKRDTDESMVTKEAVAIQYMDDDTLYMFADTLFSYKDSTENRIFRAYHEVSFYMNNMQGKADSMVYFFSDSMMILYTDPILWSEANQLTGDTINIWMKNSQADSMWVGNSSFLATEEDTIGFDQIKGKEMRAKFRDNKLVRLHVIGNSESIYFNKNEEGGYEGMNKCLAQEMFIFFKDNEVSKIRFSANPEGTYHPIHEILFETNELEGLDWRIIEKPERPTVGESGIFSPSFRGNPAMADTIPSLSIPPEDMDIDDKLPQIPASREEVLKSKQLMNRPPKLEGKIEATEKNPKE